MARSAEEEANAAAVDATEPALSIVAGNPTASELAAVTAVIAALLEETEDDALQVAAPQVSAWQRSQRSIRRPLTPGAGEWRGFSA